LASLALFPHHPTSFHIGHELGPGKREKKRERRNKRGYRENEGFGGLWGRACCLIL